MNRRLFRTGDSEYLLNGKLCRLRDIQELFMGTGLGPESYALIEQGRIGQILSSRPTDRRAIIEEAAGITKFKTKKRLAEARLEDAKLNLARVNDIFEEVTRQMNSLKRQASKAERYAKLRDEMRAKLRLVLASKFAQLEQESAAARRADQRHLAKRCSSTARDGAAVRSRTRRAHAARLRHRGRSSREPRAPEPDQAGDRPRHGPAAAQRRALRGTGGPRRRRPRPNWRRRSSGWRRWRQSAMPTARFWTPQPPIWPRRNSELAQSQQEAAAAAAALAELERQQEQSRVTIVEAVAAASNLRNQLTQAEERLAGVDREAQRLQAEMATANSQVEAFGGQRGQLGLEFETVRSASRV